jgi:magnesium transporter
MPPDLNDATTAAVRAECKALIRAVYRDASGEVHLDWPAERIADALGDEGGLLWIDVLDLASADNRGAEAVLRDVFGFHPLAIEDALRDTHVPKIDDWGAYLYLVFCSIDFHPETDDPQLHELDLFLGPNYLLSYHNERLEVVERLRTNIERDPLRRLTKGADHLLYDVLDNAVGEYLPAIEHLDEAIDTAQDEVFARPSPQTLQAIFRIKRAAWKVHRMIGPMREVLNRLARDPYPTVREPERVYFRDVYDHLVRLHDVSESLRDLISGALDTYLSVSANRTNEIMKALTLVTVMFLPLSFLGGFFGMNFFGETMAFQTMLPKRLLFWGTIGLMTATPWMMYRWVRRKGWY